MEFSSIRVEPQTRRRESKRASSGLERTAKSLIVNFNAGHRAITGEIARHERGKGWQLTRSNREHESLSVC